MCREKWLEARNDRQCAGRDRGELAAAARLHRTDRESACAWHARQGVPAAAGCICSRAQ